MKTGCNMALQQRLFTYKELFNIVDTISDAGLMRLIIPL